MAEGDTFVNALLGAVVSIVLFFLPFSPLLGGLVAGYLQGGDRGDGLRVGAIAGIITLVPLVGLLLLLGGLWGFFLLGGLPLRAGAIGALGLFVFLFLFGLLAVFTVGLSAIGGWLGNYVKTDTEFGAGTVEG